jgi:adenosine deaminase
MHSYPREFIESIPKTDLHLHLDGSLRIPTLIELAKEQKIDLPSYTQEGLRELVFKSSYKDLNEYLTGFAHTCAVMHTPEAIERIAYELAWDSFNEGVRYIEVRFAPQLLMDDNLSFEEVMHSADRGFRGARFEINANILDDEPEFDYGIIVCAMRFCNENFSPYYKRFFDMHKYTSQFEIIQMLSMEVARASIKLRNETDIQIVAFDLAGAEYGYPAENHRHTFQYVHKNFMMKTVHAGEAYGPESIFQAITKCYADRIGHGLFLFNTDHIEDPKIVDRDAYVNRLANYIAERRITLEVCLTSNLQTVPEIKEVKNHPLKKMLQHNLSVTLCTDNRLVSNTTLSDEIELAVNNFDITPTQLKNIIVYGFKRSFFHDSYSKKREYVRKNINYYEKKEKEFGIVHS